MSKKKKIIERKIENIYLTRKNYIFFGLGILSIIIGYFSLSKGSITLAPILLVLGYLVLIPIGILIK